MRTVIFYILLVLLTSGVATSGPNDPIFVQELSGKVKNKVTGLPVTTGNIKIIDYSMAVPREVATLTIKSNGTYKTSSFNVANVDHVRILAYPNDVVWDGGHVKVAYSPTEGGGTGNSPHNGIYVFNLQDATVNGNVYSLDISVAWSDYVNKIFSLNQNYPNPFNPVTVISFELPVSVSATIKVFDITGKEVSVLANNEHFESGHNEIEFNGNNLPSGVYFYQISSKLYNGIKKMTLIK